MKRLRVVSYAINGRGMGHLVRQLAILRWLRRIAALLEVECECWVLTSSEADTLARREGIPALKMPSKAMLRDAGLAPAHYLAIARTWVLNAVAGLQPDVLLVDTFPGGSFGELVAALELAPHRVLVARRVRAAFAEQDPYRALLTLYEKVLVPDDRGTGPILIRDRAELLGRDAARRALGVPQGRRAVYVSLGGGGDLAAPGTLPRLVDQLQERGWHVVVGAGPLYEGPERRGAGVTWLDRYVPLELLTGVDAAVSACGYNTFHELMYAGVPTVFLPQERIADDQEERARSAVHLGAGRLARSVEEAVELLADPGDPEAARRLVPRNGARQAALEVLSLVLPAADVEMAAGLLTPELVGVLHRWTVPGRAGREAPRKALALTRMLGPGTSALATLCEAHDVPFDTAFSLVNGLRRKFPAADGASLVEAAQTLFPVWARFDDWMGAISLMRAIPTQRTLAVSRFAALVARWLVDEEDLFDALRDFSQLEASGERTVGEVLHLLARDPEAAEPASPAVHPAGDVH
jgi:hypothetical protein